MAETMLVLLESLDPLIRREMLATDPEINALVVTPYQTTQPTVKLTQMGQPFKHGDAQYTVYYGADGTVWVRVVMFIPFGFAWSRVLGSTRVDLAKVSA